MKRIAVHGPLVLGICSAIAAAAAYLPGTSSPFDPDGATTVGSVVATSHLLDVFNVDVASNNHVFFSFLEHVIYDVTGSASEATMRLLPIAFGAAVIGLWGWEIGRRFGLLASLGGTAILATHPLFAVQARSVRGYTMVTFFAVVSTLLLLRTIDQKSPKGRQLALYSVLLAAGIATHLWMFLVVLAHVVLVFVRRRTSRGFVLAWGGSAVLGLLPYLSLLRGMLARNSESRTFRPELPASVAKELLGVHPVAMVLSVVLLLLALWHLRKDALTLWYSATFLAVGMFIWLALAPAYASARYVIWVLPAVAMAYSAVMCRHRLMLAAAAAIIVAQVATLAPGWNEPLLAEKPAGAIVRGSARQGLQVCTVGYGEGPLLAYTRPSDYRKTFMEGPLVGCNVAVVVTVADVPSQRMAELRERFPYLLRLPAHAEPGLVYSDRSLCGLREYRRYAAVECAGMPTGS